jgi:hypothetical protein
MVFSLRRFKDRNAEKRFHAYFTAEKSWTHDTLPDVMIKTVQYSDCKFSQKEVEMGCIGESDNLN